MAWTQPGGDLVVTISRGNTALVWDIPTGQLLSSACRHEGPINSADFSPDSRRIVTASMDGTARIWSAYTGQPLTPALKHRAGVYAAMFSRDGRRTVTVSADRTVRVWDSQEGLPLTESIRHNDLVHSAEFSPDGQQVVTTCRDRMVRIWDVRPGKAFPLKILSRSRMESGRTEEAVGRLRPTRDKPTEEASIPLVSRLDRIVILEDYREVQKQAPADLSQMQKGIYNRGPSFLQGGELDRLLLSYLGHELTLEGARRILGDIATFGSSRTASPFAVMLPEQDPSGGRIQLVVRVFKPAPRHVTTNQELMTYERHQMDMYVGSAALWTVSPGHAAPQAGLEALHWFGYAQFSSDGLSVLTSDQGSVRFGESGFRSEPVRTSAGLEHTQFSPDGQHAVAVSTEGATNVVQLSAFDPKEHPVYRGASPGRLRFSRDGRRYLTLSGHTVFAGGDWKVQVWGLGETGVQASISVPGPIYCAEFSPDGNKCVIASPDHRGRVWSIDGKMVELKHDGPVHQAQFSPQGNCVATASEDGTARVWDAQTGQPLTSPMKHLGPVFSARFDPEGRRLATASADKTAIVWDTVSGESLTQPLRHGGIVYSAVFSPDGTRIVTASADKTVRVWDSGSGLVLSEHLEHQGQVFGADFSPDGKWVVASSEDGVRVWFVGVPRTACPDWLPPLAEAVSGQRLNQQGVLDVTGQEPAEVLSRVRRQLHQTPGGDEWAAWGRWFLADRATRTISPLSGITVPDYIERRITEGTLKSLDEAETLAAGNPGILQRIAAARPAARRLELARNPIEGLGPNNADAANETSELSLNNVCWKLATSPSANERDGHIAVALAKKVVARTSRREPMYLDTLAAAYAEVGDFHRAVSNQQEAIALLKDDDSWKPDFTYRLWLYQSNTPYRDNSTNTLSAAAETPELRQHFLKYRGALAAQFGLWKEGARNLAEMVKLNPDEHRNWYQLAPLLLEAGDLAGYRNHCRAMLARFGDTGSSPLAERTAKVCLLSPLEGADIAAACKLAETAVTGDSDDVWAAYYQFVKGLADYRQGSFGAAAEWAQKALEQTGVDYYCEVEAWSVLALARYRSNRPDAARSALAKAAELAETKLPRLESGDLGRGWHDWIIAHTLLREARQLIEGGTAPGPKQ